MREKYPSACALEPWSGADPQQRVLVVGTTSDYIEWLRTQCPGQALFLTDPADRAGASEPDPLPAEELICDLGKLPLIRAALRDHLRQHGLSLHGVACFDCDSMELAAILAAHFSLPFPSLAAVRLCRDKFLSKQQWQRSRLPFPAVRLVRQRQDLEDFPGGSRGACVLKPRVGSGSQLVFCCKTMGERERAFRLLEKKGCLASEAQIVLEEWVEAPEFSCDCLVLIDRVQILRVTAKIMAEDAPLGTVRGYYLASAGLVDSARLAAVIQQAAHALGVARGVCMVDFLLHGQEIVLLELTPRPGGDCLPQLLRRARQWDMLRFNLDVARSQSEPPLSSVCHGEDWVALRLHARVPGFVERIDTTTLGQDPRVFEISIVRQTGHLVLLPPDDYGSWYLGYALFRPFPGVGIEQQCRELRGLVDIRMA